ncbi:MAG: TIGR01212 family radical SAM protein [Candidatus Eremiobacteraeota bacterium]|nr:TIGR01212 family radical SAM protein [Candidatus Eremiobacteraeota bacterium]
MAELDPLERHYRTYPVYLRRRFGAPVFRISIDAGFSCPGRDGGKPCIYCNNESFSPSLSRSTKPVSFQIREALARRSWRGRYGGFIAYFQPYTNTYAPVKHLKALYEEALAVDGCLGISIGTRPDCVDGAVLDLLAELGSRAFITVEYGLQSPHQESLLWMKRGHTLEAFQDAVRNTSLRSIATGAHIILGIPGETEPQMLETASIISGLPLTFLKIHQLQVVRGTVLAEMHDKNPFPLWSLGKYASFLCDFIEELRYDLVIQRLYSHSRPDLLIGPLWGGDRHHIENFIHRTIRATEVQQGRRRGGQEGNP